MADTLCNTIISGAEDRRTVVSLGLKMVITEMPANKAAGPNVVRRLTPRLIAGITDANADIANECMDLTCDLVSRFWPSMTPDNHLSLLAALKPQLMSTKPAIR